MRVDGFFTTVVSVSRLRLLAPGNGPQSTSLSGTWHSPTELSEVTLDMALIFAQPLLITLSVRLAKTSLFQREGQFAWIGMIAPMVVHGLIAVTNTYATGAFTAPKKRTSITKHPNAFLPSVQPSKMKDLAPYCHKLKYLFSPVPFHFFVDNLHITVKHTILYFRDSY